jgi:hypothetical protein
MGIMVRDFHQLGFSPVKMKIDRLIRSDDPGLLEDLLGCKCLKAPISAMGSGPALVSLQKMSL